MPNVSWFRIDSLESRRMLSISHGDGFGDHDDGDRDDERNHHDQDDD